MPLDKMRERARLSVAVDDFATAMEDKIMAKFDEGYGGWDDPSFEIEITSSLQNHVEALIAGDSTQAVDVANLAMFLKGVLENKDKNEI